MKSSNLSYRLRIGVTYFALCLCYARAQHKPPKQGREQAALAPVDGGCQIIIASGSATERPERYSNSCSSKAETEKHPPSSAFVVSLSPSLQHISDDLYGTGATFQKQDALGIRQWKQLLEDDSAPSRGPLNAEVTVVEFADFQCPYCRHMAEELLALQNAPSGVPSIRFVFKNLASPAHGWSNAAAVIGRCLSEISPSLFWTFHDEVFLGQAVMSESELRFDAALLLNSRTEEVTSNFIHCAASSQTQARVDADAHLAEQLGVSATPTMFANGLKHEGAIDARGLREFITRAALTSRSTGANDQQ